MKLHHIGKVVRDLDEAIRYHRETFGHLPLGDPVVDPVQKVRVVLLDVGYGHEAVIELIQPVSEDSPVQKFLAKGGGLHHLSYKTRDIQASVAEFRGKGALILGDVVPGEGHDGRATVWLYTREKELVELVEVKEN